MRRGKIFQISHSDGRGAIIDENEQDIYFNLESLKQDVQINAEVLFDIEFNGQDLIATNIVYGSLS